MGIFCGMTYRDNKCSWFGREADDALSAQGKQRSATRGPTEGHDVINFSLESNTPKDIGDQRFFDPPRTSSI
jgi:hypothetical protein